MPSVVIDGVRASHFGLTPAVDDADAVAAAVADLVTSPPDPDAALRLHDRLAEGDALRTADSLGSALRELRPPRSRVAVLARWLARNGTRREAVKTALVLLGLAGDDRDTPLLLDLGSLDEFTLFAAVALRRTRPDPGPALLDLARSVTGWGRIHAVRRLRGTTDAEVRGWLLRDGFRNGVMDEYLAHQAATDGGLADALAAPEADPALLEGAAGILAALARSDGGPAPGMPDYPDAVPALDRFADHAARAPATLGLLVPVLTLRRYLDPPPERLGWDPATAERLSARYRALAERPDWVPAVLGHLARPDRPDFASALWAADRLDLRPYPAVLRRLGARPFDAAAWHWAFAWAPEGEVAELLRMAADVLPLDRLASGPGAEGAPLAAPGAAGMALEVVLGEAVREPEAAWPLVRAGLRSGAPWSRRGALTVLRAWPPGRAPADAEALLRRAEAEEPDARLRTEIGEVRRGLSGVGD
jgi:hypothetical protein